MVLHLFKYALYAFVKVHSAQPDLLWGLAILGYHHAKVVAAVWKPNLGVPDPVNDDILDYDELGLFSQQKA